MEASFKEETEIINSYIYLTFTMSRAFPNRAACVVSFISQACYVLSVCFRALHMCSLLS